jgi:hypothetical protein
MVVGAGLVVVSNFTDGRFQRIGNLVNGGIVAAASGKTNPATVDQLKNDFVVLAGELIFVAMASVVAESSDTASNVILTMFIGLWLVWGMVNQVNIGGWLANVQPKK